MAVSVKFKIGSVDKAPGKNDCPKMLLGNSFCGKKAAPPPTSLVLAAAYRTKVNIDQKDRSAYQNGPDEEHKIQGSSKLLERFANSGQLKKSLYEYFIFLK